MPISQSNLKKILAKILWEFSLTPQLLSASEIASPASAWDACVTFCKVPILALWRFRPSFLCLSRELEIFLQECYCSPLPPATHPLALSSLLSCYSWENRTAWETEYLHSMISITKSTFFYNPLLEHQLPRLKINKWLGSFLGRSVWVSRWFAPYLILLIH